MNGRIGRWPIVYQLLTKPGHASGFERRGRHHARAIESRWARRRDSSRWQRKSTAGGRPRRRSFRSRPRNEAAYARQVRARTQLSQSEFARRIGVPVETVRNWEQGKRSPRGPARSLLKVIDNAPDLAFAALAHSFRRKTECAYVPASEIRDSGLLILFLKPVQIAGQGNLRFAKLHLNRRSFVGGSPCHIVFQFSPLPLLRLPLPLPPVPGGGGRVAAAPRPCMRLRSLPQRRSWLRLSMWSGRRSLS